MRKSTPCLYFLDVGHGNSAVLRDTEGTVVIDAGRGSSLYLFLKHEGITTIDLILISHADEDHISGLMVVLGSGEFEFKKVRLNSDAMKGTKLWDDLLYTLDEMKRDGTIDFEVSLTETYDGSYNHGLVDIQIAAPSAYLAGKSPGSKDRKGRKISTNSMSAVIRLLFEGQSVALLSGDIDKTGLENILDNAVDISASLLSFPHHGGKPGPANLIEFATTFCKLVQPNSIIFSIGRNKFSNPHPDIIATVKEVLPDVSIACTQLSKHCAEAINSNEDAHLADTFAHGREKGICCAGTIIIDMSNDEIQVRPARESHRDFISQNISHPICQKEMD